MTDDNLYDLQRPVFGEPDVADRPSLDIPAHDEPRHVTAGRWIGTALYILLVAILLGGWISADHSSRANAEALEQMERRALAGDVWSARYLTAYALLTSDPSPAVHERDFAPHRLTVRAEVTEQVFAPQTASHGVTQRISRSHARGVEQWRALVARFFPGNAVDDALSVMSKESGGDPNAVGPTFYEGGRAITCKGLFQLHPCHGEWAGADPFGPEWNVRTAARLYAASGWSKWRVKP